MSGIDWGLKSCHSIKVATCVGRRPSWGHQGALWVLVGDLHSSKFPGQGSSAKGMTDASLKTLLLRRVNLSLKPTRGPSSDPRELQA